MSGYRIVPTAALDSIAAALVPTGDGDRFDASAVNQILAALQQSRRWVTVRQAMGGAGAHLIDLGDPHEREPVIVATGLPHRLDAVARVLNGEIEREALDVAAEDPW